MNENVKKFINHPATVPVAVGVLASVSGFAVGYILGRRTKPELDKSISEALDEAVDEGVDRIQAAKADREERLAKVRQQVEEDRARRAAQVPPVVIDAETYVKTDRLSTQETITPIVSEPEADVTVDGEPVKRSIFADAEDDWNMDEEVHHRRSDRPYVIHRDEFFEESSGGPDYRQLTLTYYNGDDILVDEEQAPIYNHAQVVGEMKFGHGSGDPNVVYIRNEKLNAEYEIVLDSGFYSVEVLGIEIENNQRVKRTDIQHSANRRLRD